LSEFLVPEKVLNQTKRVMDIVTPTSTRSCCFTKGYSRYVEGTGSILDISPEKEQKILRYFTPREIANLHGFPSTYSVGEEENETHLLSNRQLYQLLGNSLNCVVVAQLIEYLLVNFEKHKGHYTL